jgi:outer membrane protein W
MKKSMMVAASMLFVAASLFAQQPNRSNTISVFVSDLSLTHSSSTVTDFDAGYGAAFDHMFSDRVSGEISVTSQKVRRFVSTFSTEGLPITSTYSDAIHPIDAMVRYHFLTGSRWKPYVGAGVRYVSNTIYGNGLLGGYHFTTRTTDPEVSGGVTFQLRPSIGLRLDAKQTVGGGRPGILGDPDFKVSAGVGFRF